MTPLHVLGPAEAAQGIESGAFSSATLAGALIARIRRLEPAIQAWAWVDETQWLKAASRADRQMAAAGPGQGDFAAGHGPLRGVPVGIKDLIDVRGMPTGMGSPIYADHWPRVSASLVTRLERAGAVVPGKTVTTEFAFMVPSRTRNPWNTGHTPGGSSSGSAAAVACGMIPAAMGTQTNGSVIRPAAFCGVVGFKPGLGQISTDGILPFSHTLDQPGVFARSVADAALVASAVTTHESELSHAPPRLKVAPALLAVRTPAWDRADDDQRARFAADLQLLRDAGAKVEERELPADFADAWRIHRAIMLHEAALAARPIRALYQSGISDFLNTALDEGEAMSDSVYRRALESRSHLIRAFQAFLEDRFAAVVTPPAPGEAPAGLETTGDPAFCTLWTLLGVPAITLPTGLGRRGLPLGLQIVSRPLETNYLLAVAGWCESHLPFDNLLVRAASTV
jgi:Asp-tRNA(Asn)/Glu-tRNA(Gln) amidotransferase A subunit family amidase